MKIVIGLCLWIGGSMPLAAEGWDVMYLANTGGTHLMQVDPSEAQQINAFVKSDGGGAYFLVVDCRFINIANGEPFLDPSVELFGSFDGAANHSLGMFDYAGGAYSSPYEADLIKNFAAHKDLLISDPDSGFSALFVLDGFSQAYEKTGCLRGEP